MKLPVLHSVRGFSLVEFMIAIVLGLILIAGVIQVFVGNRQTQLAEQSVARVQESGRLAIAFIEEDLRQTGFYGAGNIPGALSNPVVLNRAQEYPQYDHFTRDALRVYSLSTEGNVWTPSSPAAVNDINAAAVARARPGSDFLAIFYGYDTGATLKLVVGGNDKVVLTRNMACFEKNELAMLSNPGGGVLFKVTNKPDCTGNEITLEHTAAGGNSSDSLGLGTYTPFAKVLKLQHRVYFVGDTGRRNSQGGVVWALFRSANGGVAEELVEGIEFLKLEYGERLASGNVRYGNAGVVSNDSITSARIGVLAQGFDAVRTNDDTTDYVLPGGKVFHNGAGVHHDGGRTLRRVFTANVELRNRAQ